MGNHFLFYIDFYTQKETLMIKILNTHFLISSHIKHTPQSISFRVPRFLFLSLRIWGDQFNSLEHGANLLDSYMKKKTSICFLEAALLTLASQLDDRQLWPYHHQRWVTKDASPRHASHSLLSRSKSVASSSYVRKSRIVVTALSTCTWLCWL